MVVLAEDRKTMLIGFSVSNYKSFFQEQHISFVASKVARHKNHIVQHGMRKIVKAAVVYGANAGGKSNLISAIGFSRRIILYGLSVWQRGALRSRGYFDIRYMQEIMNITMESRFLI